MDKCQHSTIGFINTYQRTIPAHFQQCFMTDENKMIINSSIKSHPFFENIDFDRLHETTPPQIQSYVSDPDEPDSVWAKFPEMEPGLGPGAMTRMLRLQIEEGSLEESDPEDEDPTLDENSSLNHHHLC